MPISKKPQTVRKHIPPQAAYLLDELKAAPQACKRSAVADLRREAAAHLRNARYWETIARVPSRGKTCRENAIFYRQLADFVRVLLLAVLVLCTSCNGWFTTSPCMDGPADPRQMPTRECAGSSVGRMLVPVPGIGWTCACPGSPYLLLLVDGGK